MSKVMVIHNNAEHFNDDCDLFNFANEDLENGVAQTVWDSVAPTIPKRSMLGTFQTLQEGLEETFTENISDTSDNNSTKSSANPFMSAAVMLECLTKNRSTWLCTAGHGARVT